MYEENLHIIHVNLAKGFRGGERQTALLIQALQRHVDQQTLVCRKDSPLRNELLCIENLRFVDANQQIAGHRQAGHASVVHAHEAKAVHWAWLHKRIYGTPYVLTRRVDTPIKDKLVNRLFYSDADCCVAISSIIRQQLSCWSKHDVLTIPSAMTGFTADPEVAAHFRASYPGRFIVGHIGALVDRHKGQRILLEAAARLQHSHPEVLFVFFGRGEDEEALHSESSHLKNVVWAGFKSNIGDFIPALDLFVFPSRNEGLGSVLLDVMDANVPIIASNVGGIPDLIKNGETGILVTPGSTEEIESWIVKLVKNKSMRESFVENARHLLEFYSKEKMAESYLDAYEGAVLNERFFKS
ncbi:glycosyltransferase family 4 protein [Halomonas qaidamensis]|uniref:glycosyltransferase family 4 protein n=1 Tax=Halomonas qaidamensis TaxID=2866211 RepID=UPI002222945F|nr:glycosyltransferase family 4 protein [Halomonas qaidamensis]